MLAELCTMSTRLPIDPLSAQRSARAATHDKTVVTRPERCVACKSCELACAVEHSQSKTLFQAIHESPKPPRHIHVVSVAPYSYPARCVHCSEAACIAACPTGAMHRSADGLAVRCDHDRCIGCWMCVVTCPFGGVTANEASTKASKCDLCPERTDTGAEPACVAACPTKALVYQSPQTAAAARQNQAAQAATGCSSAPTPSGLEQLRNLKKAHRHG